MRKEPVFRENGKASKWSVGGIGTFLITILCWIPLFSFDIFPLDLLMMYMGTIPASIVFVLIVFVSVIVSIIIHEAGHLLFGILSGYSFCSFRIFSLMIVKTDAGMKFKKLSVPGTSGQCLLVPPECKDRKMPTIAYNLGGFILGFASAVIFGLLAFLLCNYVLIYMLLVALCVANITISLTNGIPMRVGLIDNDGKNAVSLIKNSKAAHALKIQLLVNAENSRGVSLSDMPDEWFVMPNDTELVDSLMHSQAYICFSRHFEKGEYDEAKEIAERLLALDNLLGLHRATLGVSLAYINTIKGEYAEVERFFKKEYYKNSSLYLMDLSSSRCRYAYELLVKGSEKGAKRELQMFNFIVRKLKKYPFSDVIERERKLIRDVDMIYTKRINESPYLTDNFPTER